ncbi:MAG: Ribosomal protein, partial [Verrucomicrobiota bacterium]
MLRIRLQRFGTKNEPTYRLVVAEQSIRRDGRFVE